MLNPEKVGKFIKDIRKKNNLTQKELADKCLFRILWPDYRLYAELQF